MTNRNRSVRIPETARAYCARNGVRLPLSDELPVIFAGLPLDAVPVGATSDGSFQAAISSIDRVFGPSANNGVLRNAS